MEAWNPPMMKKALGDESTVGARLVEDLWLSNNCKIAPGGV